MRTNCRKVELLLILKLTPLAWNNSTSPLSNSIAYLSTSTTTSTAATTAAWLTNPESSTGRGRSGQPDPLQVLHQRSAAGVQTRPPYGAGVRLLGRSYVEAGSARGPPGRLRSCRTFVRPGRYWWGSPRLTRITCIHPSRTPETVEIKYLFSIPETDDFIMKNFTFPMENGETIPGFLSHYNIIIKMPSKLPSISAIEGFYSGPFIWK